MAKLNYSLKRLEDCIFSVDELISIALGLVTKEDISKLQKSSLRNKDRQAIFKINSR